jgi:hypothetical protein
MPTTWVTPIPRPRSAASPANSATAASRSSARESLGANRLGPELKKQFGGLCVANEFHTRDSAEQLLEKGETESDEMLRGDGQQPTPLPSANSSSPIPRNCHSKPVEESLLFARKPRSTRPTNKPSTPTARRDTPIIRLYRIEAEHYRQRNGKKFQVSRVDPFYFEDRGAFLGIIALTSSNQSDVTQFAKHKRQTEFGMLDADLPGDAAECALCWRDEIIFLTMFLAVLHGNCSIALSWLGEQVLDSANRLGGLVWLSQTAQRSASGA